jgi:hypothetical protein
MNTFRRMNKLFKILIAAAMLLPLENLQAQSFDTLRLMTYNLMYYRENTSFCTSTNNSPTVKDNAMEDIIDYALPDILMVNEMGGGNTVNAFRLLSNALNKNGRNYYSQATSSGLGQSLVNMLYYNSNKLTLESQTSIDKDLNNVNLVRVIDVYTLRYNDPNLGVHNDTIRIHCIVAHLKAGNTTSDRNDRDKATDAVMAYLNSIAATGNYFFAGDLNLYTATEAAYQNLLNYSVPALRFYDPVNVAASWSGDSRFAILHTQSTHTSGGCFAGGGMDDRLDFILASDEVMNNTDHLDYIPSTYKALGQDGNRFNGTIISPTNNSVPSLVSQALYNLSDHLPVMMDVKVSVPGATSIQEQQELSQLLYQNPNSGNLKINFGKQGSLPERIQILDITGKIILEKRINNRSKLELDLTGMSNGTYFIRSISKSYQQKVEKLIKI